MVPPDVNKSIQPTGSVGLRPYASRKVLLVDPNSRDLEYYRSVLLDQGHAVRACASYTEGTILLNRDHFDLIIVNQGSRNIIPALAGPDKGHGQPRAGLGSQA